MRSLLVACLCVSSVAAASPPATQPAAPGCAKDTDCKGDRVCDGGRCVDRAPAPVTTPAAAEAAPAMSPPVVVARPAPMEYERRQPQNAILINPASLLGGEIGISYERVLAPWVSLGLGVAFYDSAIALINKSDQTILGGAVTVQPRFYLLPRGAPAGLYLSPVATVAYLGADDGYGGRITGAGYSVGALVGWGWVAGAFALKVGLGASYLHYRVTAEDLVTMDGDPVSIGAAGPTLLGELAVGWAF